jgi:hypothetical protein
MLNYYVIISSCHIWNMIVINVISNVTWWYNNIIVFKCKQGGMKKMWFVPLQQNIYWSSQTWNTIHFWPKWQYLFVGHYFYHDLLYGKNKTFATNNLGIINISKFYSIKNKHL